MATAHDPAAARGDTRNGGYERLLGASVEHFAEHGIGDSSVRGIAQAVGTSHRMLIYHFGGREGLVSAVIAALEERQRQLLSSIASRPGDDLVERAWSYWLEVAGAVERYGPLYFELAALAMRRGRPESEPLRLPDTEQWTQVLGRLWASFGMDPREAATMARLNLAVSRGLLHDLLLTGQREVADEAMAMFVKQFTGTDPRHRDNEDG